MVSLLKIASLVARLLHRRGLLRADCIRKTGLHLYPSHTRMAAADDRIRLDDHIQNNGREGHLHYTRIVRAYDPSDDHCTHFCRR